MLGRLKVTITQKEESEKNLLWELSTLKDLRLVKFNNGKFREVQNGNYAYEEGLKYSVEFSTRLNKVKAIQQIASMFMKKDFKAFEIIEIK